MKRLLCIVGSMDAGGAETFLMKLYRKMNKNKYQMDFYVLKQEHGFYNEEIKALGGRIFYGIAKSNGFLNYVHTLKKVIQENQYDYVLRMSQNSLAALDLAIAKHVGAKRVIFRSTNSHVYGGRIENIIHYFFKPMANQVTDVKIAPSKEAAIFMFGEKTLQKGDVYILNNGIDLETYRFCKEKREVIRKELGLGKKFVIGHVGRFNVQKNHVFLIEVFEEVKKRRENAVLMLLGKGECEEKIKTLVYEKGLEDNVIFLGVKRNVSDYYAAMDFFVFPSLYEGMPNTVIEAQASGLPCLVSDVVTKDARITDYVYFENIQKGTAEWADSIINRSRIVYERDNEKIVQDFVKKGFSIEDVKETFTEIVFGE